MPEFEMTLQVFSRASIRPISGKYFFPYDRKRKNLFQSKLIDIVILTYNRIGLRVTSHHRFL